VPYDGMPSPPVRYSQPQLTKRTKLVLAGVGLAVFTAVLTIAITKSGSSSRATAKKSDTKTETITATSIERPAETEPRAIAQPTVEPDEGPTVDPIES